MSQFQTYSKSQQSAMRFILITLILLFLGSLKIQCSDILVKNDQSVQKDEMEKEELKIIFNDFNIQSYDPSYQKLLSVERQILMSEQMIKLYQERLSVLKELRENLKMDLSKQIIQSQTHQKFSESSDVKSEGNKRNEKVQQNKQNQYVSHKNQVNRYACISQNTAYVFLKQYQIDVSGSKKKSVVDGSITLLHPFVINKAKSQISILSSENNSDKIPKFQYGIISNRLLFYWFEKRNQEKKMHEIYNQQEKVTHFILNLAIQIKPNKIKSVKINYYQKSLSNQSSLVDNFIVQEVVTSYESNELISSDFKWHKALQFENLIIGFANHKVYIKGKQKKMNQVEIGSKVLAVYSLNQYKLLYIAEDKIGTINVRSLTKSDQISFEYYLGNKTIIQQKQLEKKYPHQNFQIQDSYSHESFDPGSYWHSPFSKNFSSLRAISFYYLQTTKQLFILLSNGELILYENQKFTASTNLGTQLMKILKFDDLLTKADQKNFQKIKIKMDLLPSFKHILISSNFCNKILIFNVTIPHLTAISKKSAMSFFSSSARSNELAVKYWQNLQIRGKMQQQKQRNGISFYESQIYVFTRSPSLNQGTPQVAKRSIDIDEKVVYLYYCQYSNLNINSYLKGQQNNQNKYAQKSSSNQHIMISQYRLLLNLLDHNSLTSITSQNSQGRSLWWNILLVTMIATGVLVIRKCRQSSSQPKKPREDPAPQKFYKTKNSLHSTSNQAITNEIPKITKQQNNLEKRSTITKTKIQYDNMVISQLQNYLEKQGQKLSKQEIAYMIRQMQQSQQNLMKKKAQMKPQYKNEQTQPDNADLLQNNNTKNVDHKQKKNQNEQEEKKPQKVYQNSKRKKQ